MSAGKATDRWVLMPTDYEHGVTDAEVVAVLQGARAWHEMMEEEKLYPRWRDAMEVGLRKLGLAYSQSAKRLGAPAIKYLMVKHRGERFH